MNEQTVFITALERTDPADRAVYLDRACGTDVVFRSRIERLLQLHATRSHILDELPDRLADTADFSLPTENPGTRIGPYTLLREIGHGGMGLVYMVVQQKPVHRQLALKIIKPGLDTCEVIARFQAEEQALAMMDHPNIATVYDAGVTALPTTSSSDHVSMTNVPSGKGEAHVVGRPYFVMELVNGMPITKYCDEHCLNTRQRLELFLSICSAVHHAHQKGIIHRDLKPSNILVTLRDGVAVPKIIDFGIAKAIGGQLGATFAANDEGYLIGTPPYMSPEQVEYHGLDVDTRSDVYSLGALLYELLTGVTPYNRKQLKQAEPDELRRLICEQQPPRPSTRIFSMGQNGDRIAKRHNTDLRLLYRELHGELDWIVMKAMERDRNRRYETAKDFCRDVERYLRGEPVRACPSSRWYRLQKFVKRNQVIAVATTAVSLALMVGGAVAIHQTLRAIRAEIFVREQSRLIQRQKQLVKDSTQREHLLRTQVDAARQQSEKMADLLADIFLRQGSARDRHAVAVAEMLPQARQRINDDFRGDPLLQAKLWRAIAETYAKLGLVQEAVECAKASHDILDRNHDAQLPAFFATTILLGELLLQQGNREDAEQMLLKARQLSTRSQAVSGSDRDMQKLRTILRKLIDLYEQTDQSDKADYWRSKLDAISNVTVPKDEALLGMGEMISCRPDV